MSSKAAKRRAAYEKREEKRQRERERERKLAIYNAKDIASLAAALGIKLG